MRQSKKEARYQSRVQFYARYGDPTRIVNRGYAAVSRNNVSQRRR